MKELSYSASGRTTDNLTKKLFWCVSKKGHTAHQKFIKYDSHSPPVYRLAVALPQNNLRRDVLRCATDLQREPINIKITNILTI